METWRPILGFENYEVSDLGRIRRGELVRKTDLKNGYRRVRLSRKNTSHMKTIHRLVWETFRGEIPAGYHVNHIDRDRENNALSNLNVMTPKENNLHYKSLLTYRGSLVSTSKFTEEDVLEIRRRRASGERRVDLAREFEVNESSIYRVVKGQNWSHIP